MPESVDFSALIPEPWEIKSREGQVFKADPDLSGEEAMHILRNAGNLTGLDSAERAIQIVLRSMQRCQPGMTEADLLKHFRLNEIINLTVRFLAQIGPVAQSRAGTPINRKQRRLAKKR